MYMQHKIPTLKIQLSADALPIAKHIGSTCLSAFSGVRQSLTSCPAIHLFSVCDFYEPHINTPVNLI